MMEFFKDSYYWIDFSIGTAIPLVVFALYRTGRIGRFIWYLFWVGAAVGLTWELPMSLLNEYSTTNPMVTFITPLPTHFSVIIITHSFWDGGLFLGGVWMVYKFCPEPRFDKFNIKELIVLLAWGQVSELAVELSSTYAGGWEFISYWWNPTLFMFNDKNITLFPQLIWFVAPIVFYPIALKLKSKTG